MTCDIVLLLPLVIVTLGAILLMLLSAFETIRIEVASALCMGVFATAFIMQLVPAGPDSSQPFVTIFNGMLAVSSFTQVASLIILACGFFTAMTSSTYFRQNAFGTLEFYCLMTFAASGMLLLTMAQELITVFIALEIVSLSIYILVGYNRKSAKSSEAVLKYLMLGAFAGAFLTMGAALIYGATGSTSFAAIAAYISRDGFLANPALAGGVLFILFALFFKVTVFPFHAWVLDVYDGASMPVTGFMATALKTSVFAVLANILLLDADIRETWVDMLFYLTVFTLFAGNLIAIGQNSLKRMLAASGIVHTGYLLIALIAAGSEHFNGSVILFYLAAYSISTLGIFASLSYLSGTDEKRQNFADFRGLAKVRPFSAAAITIFLLSMAGIPPTAGFMGKLYIIVTAFQAGQTALAVLGIVSSVLSMWYYMRLIIAMYFHEAEDRFEISSSRSAPVCAFILAVCVLAMSLYPVAI